MSAPWKRFRWGILLPALLLFVCGIVLAAGKYASIVKNGWIPVGILLLLTGLGIVISFFFSGDSENVAWLLCGAAALATAVWLFIVGELSVRVLTYALVAFVVLRCVADVLEGVACLKEGRVIAAVLFFVSAALFLALAIVAAVDPFRNYPCLQHWIGGMLIGEGVAVALLCFVEGVFRHPQKK